MSDECERITAYLTGGGLFNPELANHDAVRDLLIDCRAALAAAPAQPDAHMQMASPIFALAVQALNGVKAWRDCEGNDGFPDEVREQIDAVLSAFELRYTTHPTTGEPMGTDAQEATAWRLAAENLQRENAALRGALEGAVSMAKDAHGHWDEDRDAKVGKHLLALAGANKGYDKRADAIHAALAGTAPATSKEYAELPEDGYLFATGCGGCVKVWSATQMQAFADATHALRSKGDKP